MVSFLPLALLATSAVASPVVLHPKIPDNWVWQVENWGAGCIGTGCYAFFNVTVPSTDEMQGAKAKCITYEQGADNYFTIPSTYTPCTTLEGGQNSIQARFSLRPADGTGHGPQQIEVSFLRPGSDADPTYYNYSACHDITYNQFVSPAYNFTMTPTEVSWHF
ncbi:hypothetical protein ACEQ8H_004149 [Pleosporales sp. CAS-2024a]